MGGGTGGGKSDQIGQAEVPERWGLVRQTKRAATGSGWVGLPGRVSVPQRKWSLIILMNSGTLDLKGVELQLV